MVTVTLAYGSDGLDVTLPDEATTVVVPAHHPATRPADVIIAEALADPIDSVPLRDMVSPGDKVAISVCDITRPQPRQVMVEAVLSELAGIIDPADVTILIATGTHRASTDAERVMMLGDTIVSTCRVIDHDARDATNLTWVGTFGDGVPVWLNSAWVDADVRITTGFVEPHFFAGFSGGPKMVAPGLAALETVLHLHDARRIGHPNATWGICEGNPVHDDVRAIAAATGVNFSIDVILNRDQQVTHAFAGELLAMHAEARDVARQVAMQQVDAPFDVVVTTNSGWPLDQNLYQAVKGMTAALNIVKPGGTIICAAECRDGLPDHGLYAELLRSEPSPQALLDAIAANERTIADQWQVQMQARVQVKARVLVYADGLTDQQLRDAQLEPCRDIEAAVAEALAAAGPHATVCVLPEGPQTIPYLAAAVPA